MRDISPDYILIGIIVFGVIGSYIQVMKEKERITISATLLFLLTGLSLIIVATTANSIFEKKWESEYIISFLMLRRVSEEWFYRHLCGVGYLLSWIGFCLAIAYLRKGVNKTGA
ncbi:MAG: hypothetical protein HZB62_12005 [Nitrospirae bacterium]|nr:hypothetical protein [Nitrospirota bacterium]